MSNLSILLSIFSIYAASKSDVHDYHLKSTAGITVLNHYGAVEVIGWPLDKVRIEVKKTSEKDQSYEVDQTDNKFEIRTSLGKNMFLSEKLKARRTESQTGMDLVIKAPAHVPLTVLSKSSKILIHNWSAPVDVSTQSGAIKVQNLSVPSLRIACPSCEVKVEQVKGTIKIAGGTGNVSLREITSQDLFAESSSGALSLEQVNGSGILVTESGELRAKKLEGQFAFKSRSASVLLTETKGSIHGETKSGNIHVEVKEWKSSDKQLISSEEGSIHVSLPPSFAGEIEALSQLGKLNIDFPLEKVETKKVYGPEPMNHFMGRSGRGGELLSIQSTHGNIWLLQAI